MLIKMYLLIVNLNVSSLIKLLDLQLTTTFIIDQSAKLFTCLINNH